MTFHQPSVWFLLLLLALPVLWMRWKGNRRRAAVAFSSIQPASQIGPTWAIRCRWIIPALRTFALATLILAIARPRKGDEQTRINTEAVAIQIIIDRSGSMRAQDFAIDGRAVDRLAAVKEVVRDFIMGENELPGRPDDVIGMIAFASFADTLCPLTADHGHLIESLRQMTIASDVEESATAIGDAIALGVERLRALEQRVAPGDGSGPSIKSKVIILLTDGENNAGDIDPLAAAEMAAAFDIKIYTIGAGTAKGYAPVQGTDIFGQPLHIPVSIDEPTLTKIAELAGGAYFRATDTDSLRRIYEQIDRLEKTKISERRYVTYAEAAVEPVRLGSFSLPPLPPLLLVVLVAMLIETALSATRFRTLP